MERFAVIGLDTQEKKAEAEAILKELGYRSYEDWNKRYRGSLYCDFIVSYKTGSYQYHTHDGDEPHITLDQLKAMKKEDKHTYPCMMEVWDNERNEKQGMEVIAEFIYADGEVRYAALDENRDGVSLWRYARQIQPDPLKEVIEKLKSNSVTLTHNEAQLILDALEKSQPK